MHIIYFEGAIGWDLSAEWLRDELKKAAGGPVEIHINSGGGDVFVGQSMIDSVRRYAGHVTARIIGTAASMASALAVACDLVAVTDLSSFMIHRAAGGARGNSEDMKKLIEILDGVDNSLATLYSRKTGKSVAEILELMRIETWYFAEEILNNNFADVFEDTGSSTAKSTALATARSRFAAAYHLPTMEQVAAYLGNSPTPRPHVKSFSEWRQQYPHNAKVREIIDRAERKGLSASACSIALTMATDGSSMSAEDRAAAEIVGLSPSEYMRYAPQPDALTPDELDRQAADIAGMTVSELRKHAR